MKENNPYAPPESNQGKTAGNILNLILASFFLVPYILVSQRVENTFVH